MYKCVVFDLDGTLVNSLYDIGDSVNRALVAHGLPTHSYEEYKYFVGNGRTKLIERAMGESFIDSKLFSSVADYYDDDYLLHCLDKTLPYSGMPQVLSKLKQCGVKICVLSNKPDEFVNNILNTLFPKISFDVAWGKKSGFPPKPDPSSLSEIFRSIGLNCGDCLFVGDSAVDVITAKNAGVDFCGVLWGFRTEEELKSEGAQILVNNSSELLQVILNGGE